MNSRERVAAALSHTETDRVPVDLGGAVVTGIHAAALDRLRKALGLEDRPVKVYEPMMMLGAVEGDVLEAIGGDVVGLNAPGTLLGYRNENWKSWALPDGTPVLMGRGVQIHPGCGWHDQAVGDRLVAWTRRRPCPSGLRPRWRRKHGTMWRCSPRGVGSCARRFTISRGRLRWRISWRSSGRSTND